jgi:hypothetical protein
MGDSSLGASQKDWACRLIGENQSPMLRCGNPNYWTPSGGKLGRSPAAQQAADLILTNPI